jgi:hypothetical protein
MEQSEHEGSIENEDEDEEDEQQPRRAARNSKPRKPAAPDALGYYPSTWKKVLTNAKDKYRLFLVKFEGFPECQKDVGALVAEAIDDAVESGLLLDDGKCAIS